MVTNVKPDQASGSNSNGSSPLDLLVIGAHPDDAELFAGGTMAIAVGRGRRVGIVDLTRGECGTRGTPQTRAKEAADAAKILGIHHRENLDLGDGRIENSDAARIKVVELLRRLKPRVVVTHETESRHPDHTRTHELVRDACFLANVGGYEAKGERHKIEELVFFVGHELRGESKPDWIVDTTATHEQKIKSLRAYATQFYNPDSKGGPSTLLSSPEFWEHLDRRSRAFGYLIGTTHGEAFNFQRAPHTGHAFIKLA